MNSFAVGDRVLFDLYPFPVVGEVVSISCYNCDCGKCSCDKQNYIWIAWDDLKNYPPTKHHCDLKSISKISEIKSGKEMKL